jgi:hypothetical protein
LNEYEPDSGNRFGAMQKEGWNRKAIAAFVLELSAPVIVVAVLIVSVLTVVLTAGSGATVTHGQAYRTGAVVGDIFSVITLLVAIVGLVYAHKAMSRMLSDLRGRGLAVAALVIGYFNVAVFLLRLLASVIASYYNLQH